MKRGKFSFKKIRHQKLIVPLIVFIIVGFLTWLTISLLSIDINIKLTTTYTLPGFENLSDLKDIDYGGYTIAVDKQIVSGKNQEEVLPTASIAKMILSLAIMQKKPFNLGESGENIEINQEFFDKYVWYYYNGGSVSEVRVGEIISEYDALVSTLLVSSNNMADSLAIWAFGSLDDYRDYATNMLRDWGLNNTNIGIDASGFDSSTTSTASDLAIIGTKVLENPVLKEIVNLQEYTVPVAGELQNTNKLLGQSKISGVKTGYIGDESGYCLVSGYEEDGHVMVLALLKAPTRETSFDDSLAIINQVQEKLTPKKIISTGDIIGYYDSWWTGKIDIVAEEDLSVIGWDGANAKIDLEMNDNVGTLKIVIGEREYLTKVSSSEYKTKPDFFEKVIHVFGWSNSEKQDVATELDTDEEANSESDDEENLDTDTVTKPDNKSDEETLSPITNAPSDNCTIKYGTLMLINPNFMVDNDFIYNRRGELVSISSLYGIVEGNPYNGDNLLDAEAAVHMNDLVKAYEAEYPGHTLETRSCFRAVGTKCGRLCAATGASDHHTGLTCDLLDPVYGTELDTDYYDQHIDWQWLKANSYKYGFIDRFPAAWAGGPMSEPLNVDENGTTGLFETWHYRYVGIQAATEIADGKYNNGEYDSLEHYLKARGIVADLKNGTCE